MERKGYMTVYGKICLNENAKNKNI